VLHNVAIHNIIYYLLTHTLNYNTFRLAVYPTCFDIYSVIFRGVCLVSKIKADTPEDDVVDVATFGINSKLPKCVAIDGI
jgi:hypothetical protein